MATEIKKKINIADISLERIIKIYNFASISCVTENILEKLGIDSDDKFEEYIKQNYPEIVEMDETEIEGVFKYLVLAMKKNNHYLYPIFRSIYNKSKNHNVISEEITQWIEKCAKLMTDDINHTLPPFPVQQWVKDGGYMNRKKQNELHYRSFSEQNKSEYYKKHRSYGMNYGNHKHFQQNKMAHHDPSVYARDDWMV